MITLDLTGLSPGSRTTPGGGSLYFDVNAASAGAAVETTNFTGADFQLFNNSAYAGIAGVGGNAIAVSADKGARFSLGQSVGNSDVFNSGSATKIARFVAAPPYVSGNFGNFAPGDTGYLGLRFTIDGPWDLKLTTAGRTSP